MSVTVCVFILSRNWFLFAFFAVSLNVPLCCCHTMKIPTHTEACISLSLCACMCVRVCVCIIQIVFSRNSYEIPSKVKEACLVYFD